MAKIFTLPRAVAIDSSGAPYPGAKASFYLTGTVTPTDTYQDDALTTAHANPVVADSNGVFAPIYLDESVIYKLTLTQSDDTLIYTEDPVSETAAPHYRQTSAESSAGVTPTNYQYPELHVLRYGTNTTPGTTDMSTALAACNSVVSQYDAGDIILPNEAVAWDGNLDISRYARIKGSGWGSKLKALSSSALIRIDGGDNTFEDLFIEGSVVTPGSYVGTAIQVGITDFVGRIKFKNVYVRRFALGINMRAALWTKFDHCFIEFNQIGIDFNALSGSHQSNDTVFIETVVAFNERQGIATSNSPIANRGFKFIGGSIEGNGDDDYTTYAQCQLERFSEIDITTYFESISTNKPDALTIDNCSGSIHDCSFIGVRDAIKDTTGSTTSLLRIHGNKGSGIVNRALDVAGGTDNIAYSNSWGSPGTSSIFTGTRCHEYASGRFAEFIAEQTSFTPTLVGAGTAGSPTYTTQVGFYSRVDNLIFVQGRVSVSALGGMAGAVSVQGLPATSVNNTHGHGNCVVIIDGCTAPSSNTQFTGQIPENSSQIDLVAQGTTASASITAADLAASTTVEFSGWYVAA